MTSQHTVRTRVAPSPTGQPHFGLLLQALINTIIARQNQGAFVLRIEDTDQKRYDPQAEAAILDALNWANLTPDEGPHHPGAFGPYRQSERLELYQQTATKLIEHGHAYYCFCSPERLAQVRDEQQKNKQVPMYDKLCRALDPAEATRRAQAEPHVVRLKVPANQTIVLNDEIRGAISFQSDLVDDQVLLKSDGFPTYHLAVVVDDHAMEISHVVRGEEWLSSAPKHVLLYQMLQWEAPKFIHTPTLRNPDKSKLSKRHGHSAIQWYQEKGYLPEAVINFLLNIVWTHPQQLEQFSLEQVLPLIAIADLHITGPIVNLEKLNWLNGLYIRQLSDQQLEERLIPFIPSHFPQHSLPLTIPLIKDRLTTLSDFSELTSFFYGSITVEPTNLLKRATANEVTEQLSATLTTLSTLQPWTHEAIEAQIRRLQTEHDWSRKQYFMMLRYAVTGKTATPPLFETMSVIGQAEICSRLESALQLVHTKLDAQ